MNLVRIPRPKGPLRSWSPHQVRQQDLGIAINKATALKPEGLPEEGPPKAATGGDRNTMPHDYESGLQI